MKYIILVFLFITLPLKAFESTNIQLLYSNSFDGNSFVYDTQDGKKNYTNLRSF